MTPSPPAKPVCPYCRVAIDASTELATSCPSCGTPHHLDCWIENGGCTVFGCASAPVEEAMVHLHPNEVAAAALPGDPPGNASTQEHGDTTGVAPPPSTSRLPEAGGISNQFASSGDPFSSSIPLAQVHPETSTERSYYVILAVISGFLGAHNLYANRTSAGIIQLCITFLTCFLALPIIWIWALVEAATIEVDGDGVPMR